MYIMYINTEFGHLSYLGNFRYWETFTLGNFRWETFVWASFVWETFVAPENVMCGEDLKASFPFANL